MIKNGLYCDKCGKKVLVAQEMRLWIPEVGGTGQIVQWDVCEDCVKKMGGR